MDGVSGDAKKDPVLCLERTVEVGKGGNRSWKSGAAALYFIGEADDRYVWVSAS
jgi:hypothetical protein